MPTNELDAQPASGTDLAALYAMYGFVYAPIGGGDGSDDPPAGDPPADDSDDDDDEHDESPSVEALKSALAKERADRKRVERALRAAKKGGQGDPGKPAGETPGKGGDDPAFKKFQDRLDAYEQTIAAMQRKEQVGKVTSLAVKAAKAAGAESPSAVARMIHLDELELDDEADDDDITDAITEAIAALKEDEPILFGQRKRTSNGSGDGGEGTGKPGKQAPQDAFGVSRLRYAYEQTSKQR